MSSIHVDTGVPLLFLLTLLCGIQAAVSQTVISTQQVVFPFLGGGNACLTITNMASQFGYVVNTAVCAGTSTTQGANQVWLFQADGTVYNAATNLCLDIGGGSTSNGAAIDAYQCNGTPSQAWSLRTIPAPSYAGARMQFYNSMSGRCLDANNVVGNQLQLWDCITLAGYGSAGYGNQAWLAFTSTPPSPVPMPTPRPTPSSIASDCTLRCCLGNYCTPITVSYTSGSSVTCASQASAASALPASCPSVGSSGFFSSSYSSISVTPTPTPTPTKASGVARSSVMVGLAVAAVVALL